MNLQVGVKEWQDLDDRCWYERIKSNYFMHNRVRMIAASFLTKTSIDRLKAGAKPILHKSC